MLWEGRLVVSSDWGTRTENLAEPKLASNQNFAPNEVISDPTSGDDTSKVGIALQICETSSDREILPPLPPVLHQTAFAAPHFIPLWAIQTPELAVYSSDPVAAKYFGKMSAHNVGILVRIPLTTANDHDLKYDHILFYAVRESPARICARPLHLYQDWAASVPTAPASELGESVDSPQTAIPSPAPIFPAQCGIDGPRKALQQIILGAMRLRGIERSHRDYKSLYQHCLRAAEFSLRNYPQPISLDTMRDKVENLLSVLE